MKLKYEQTGSRAILYDADRIQHPRPDLFDPAYWRARSAVVGEAPGRGSALLLDTDFGPAVLRRYLRGGLAARISPDRYLFTGFQSCRAFREIRLLARLAERGLPVPQPLGGLCVRRGPFYTGALLTRRIEGAVALADRIAELEPGDPVWVEIGHVVRRMHASGVVHADLNARNIVLGVGGAVYLLDFDRARLTGATSRAFRRNLERLRRSLVKLWPSGQAGDLETAWRSLRQGYRGCKSHE